MKPVSSLLFCLTAACIAAIPSRAALERNVEKTFQVSAAGRIRLETGGGSLTVKTGPEGVVTITAREKIRANSDAEADELLKDLELKFAQNGNDVSASARYTRSRLGFHFGFWPPVQVSFVATVPASFAADLNTSGGSITVGDLLGALDARTSGGSIKLGKLGGRVDARTSGGSINLAEARDDAKLSTSGGSVTVGRVAGPADISTSGGSISIEAVEQQVRAHTSGGGIRVGIVGPVKGDCLLSTSGGGVNVTVDKRAAFHLNAATSGGSVRAEGLTITLEGGDQGKTKLSGDVNGGGPEVKLRTSGGSIHIEAR
jgi:DUF4097 and DUF4098 domain-containing protein YvlB